MWRGSTSRISRTARALTLAAALLLGAMYVTPVWSVRLVAPQYPEGLGMTIRLHTIEGVKEHDLKNINSLNHYIGMRAIEPDAIPELMYMPWIAGGLIAAGVLVAALGRRRLLVAWVSSFALLGAAGLYDFWRWSYDYGHNLDLENAIIVVPGMTYQPPLIGTKQLLNFTATSLPAIGGVLAGLAFALALAAIVLSYRRRPLSAAVLALATTACAGGQPHIEFGRDACVECRMVISDRRFGGIAVSEHGKHLTFDSIDCMQQYLAREPDAVPRAVWVVNADTPGTLIRFSQAILRTDSALRPPMGTVVSYGASGAR
jgi:copper chaperone NosL